jgi:hypothetical protein
MLLNAAEVRCGHYAIELGAGSPLGKVLTPRCPPRAPTGRHFNVGQSALGRQPHVRAPAGLTRRATALDPDCSTDYDQGHWVTSRHRTSGKLAMGPIEQIQQVVLGTQRDQPRPRSLQFGQVVRQPLGEYLAEVLVPPLRGQFPSVPLPHLEAAACCTVLGPRRCGPPPAALVAELEGLIGQCPQPAADLAIAYGLRWRRAARCGDPIWDDAWPGPIQEAVDMALTFVKQSRKVLEHEVLGGFTLMPDEVKHYALAVADAFVSPAPPTGSTAQQEYQSVQKWDPNEGNLPGWAQRAIEGAPPLHGRFQTNWFRQGLLFEELRNDGRLDIGESAVRRCLGSPRFRATDIRDWRGLCLALLAGDGSPRSDAAQRVWNKLGAEGRQAMSDLLTADTGHNHLHEAILGALNSLLDCQDLFDPGSLPSPATPGEPTCWRQRKVKAGIRRLNRVLLEAAFPRCVAPNPCLNQPHETLFGLEECQQCGEEYGHDHTLFLSKDRLIVPENLGTRSFWVCRSSKEPSYFDGALTECPHCGTESGQRRTTLFVSPKWGHEVPLPKKYRSAIGKEVRHEDPQDD